MVKTRNKTQIQLLTDRAVAGVAEFGLTQPVKTGDDKILIPGFKSQLQQNPKEN